MEETNEEHQRKNILFLSSSFVNLAKLLALNSKDYDVFLLLDRRFPFHIEDEELDNFYVFTFDKHKLFEKDREKYFDNLGIYLMQFEPDMIITDNFTKILPKSFIDFIHFRFPKTPIINIHQGDLNCIENGKMSFSGLNGDVKEILEKETMSSVIHYIEDEQIDTGEQIFTSHPTTLKELKQKGLLHKREEIINYRIRNVVRSYHLRTKVLNNLIKQLPNLFK